MFRTFALTSVVVLSTLFITIDPLLGMAILAVGTYLYMDSVHYANGKNW